MIRPMSATPTPKIHPLSRYFRDYGGWSALFASGYLRAAVVMAALGYPMWRVRGWWETPINVLPDILGFSLGGLAVFLALSGDKFLSTITSEPTDPKASISPYVRYANTFLHFIVVQLLALMVALVAQSLARFDAPTQPTWALVNECVRTAWWAVGYLIFCYALTSALAAAFALYSIVKTFDQLQRVIKQHEDAEATRCAADTPAECSPAGTTADPTARRPN